MEEEEIDFFSVLELSKDSTLEDIRKAYKALVIRWHPDKNPPSCKKEAEAKFKAITQAYEGLCDRIEKRMLNRERTDLRQSSNRCPSPFPKTFDHPAPRRANSDSHYRYFAPPTGKPPPVERRLECTLEELCKGCKKEIRFTRKVFDKTISKTVTKEELQIVKVKPGWRKGTKVTFENMGDERPGSLSGDIVYVVVEKEHPYYKRVGNDLVLKMEVPLLNALTGHSFSFRLLGGEKMNCSMDGEIIHPGFEKIIPGQGMPLTKDHRTRGDLRIKFQIIFPIHLSPHQRLAIKDLLSDVS